MAHISKHHAEEERECSDCQHSWIGLQVPWNAVSVDNLLVNSCEFVRFYVCRSRNVVILIHRDPHSTVAL